MEEQREEIEEKVEEEVPEERPEALVLVGFGKHDLVTLMDAAEDGDKEALDKLVHAVGKYHWPPRYRRESICTMKEIEAFVDYTTWVQAQLKRMKR